MWYSFIYLWILPKSNNLLNRYIHRWIRRKERKARKWSKRNFKSKLRFWRKDWLLLMNLCVSNDFEHYFLHRIVREEIKKNDARYKGEKQLQENNHRNTSKNNMRINLKETSFFPFYSNAIQFEQISIMHENQLNFFLFSHTIFVRFVSN